MPKYLNLIISSLLVITQNQFYRHFDIPDCDSKETCLATKLADWQLHIFQFLDRSSDNHVSYEELLVAWNLSLPIKNNESNVDGWKENVQGHYCKTDPNAGCNFQEFVNLLEEMQDVHVRNVMRKQIDALKKSLKLFLRFFLAAAEKTDGCPPKLLAVPFHKLFTTLFECKKADNSPCITEKLVAEQVFNESFAITDEGAAEDDPCKVEGLQLTIERFEQAVLNQAFFGLVERSMKIKSDMAKNPQG